MGGRKVYAVKEIHYTLQGEGRHTGRPSVFVRFAGCNVWGGTEATRKRDASRGLCALVCDTDFLGVDGERGGRYRADELVDVVRSVSPHGWPDPWVVLTGGEPMLQVDAFLVDAIRIAGYRVAVETNGSIAPDGWAADWLTVSPKPPCPVVLSRADELKVLFPLYVPDATVISADHLYVQPVDAPGAAHSAASFVMSNPAWRLSLQAHKEAQIP